MPDSIVPLTVARRQQSHHHAARITRRLTPCQGNAASLPRCPVADSHTQVHPRVRGNCAVRSMSLSQQDSAVLPHASVYSSRATSYNFYPFIP